MPARKLASHWAPALFGLLLSGFMSLLVSGIATLRAIGLAEGFAVMWATAWLSAWLVAFPAVLIVAPWARRVVSMIVHIGSETPSR